MSDEQKFTYTIQTPTMAAFVALVEARAFKRPGQKVASKEQKPNYGATFVFDPDSEELAAIKATIAQTFRARWPGRDLKGLLYGIKDGTKEHAKWAAKQVKNAKVDDGSRDWAKGKILFKTSSLFQPALSVVQNGIIGPDLEPDGIKVNAKAFYSGVEALAQMTFKTYEGTDENPDGVKAYLDKFVSTNKGTRLKSGSSNASTFSGYAGKVSAQDPTAGLADLDDDIPF